MNKLKVALKLTSFPGVHKKINLTSANASFTSVLCQICQLWLHTRTPGGGFGKVSVIKKPHLHSETEAPM